ncbi:uncharacterized protein CCOS01_14353 [Colletotrichum costaricense]|uniref:Uncharacterized protein n=1 Tax=Colletotrichum costaricense TaxID=1209916 RepID=A0AAI9YJJ4_9PEZI|nr:uncharacterized protein CCOS01_14353 [Colletotrichum costaricense]KAK1513411.1 hypothetical protein CCOS01_14353 [Colletotrichum costaricense]
MVIGRLRIGLHQLVQLVVHDHFRTVVSSIKPHQSEPLQANLDSALPEQAPSQLISIIRPPSVDSAERSFKLIKSHLAKAHVL